MGHPKPGMIGLVNDFQEYEPDVFFNVQNLSLEKKKKLLQSAYNKRIGFHVDILDAEKSFSRNAPTGQRVMHCPQFMHTASAIG
jgi:hypothetical protein